MGMLLVAASSMGIAATQAERSRGRLMRAPDGHKAHDPHFPSWRYGPNGESEIFHSHDDVPEGWHDHPSKVIDAAQTGSKPPKPEADSIPAWQRGSAPIPAPNNATAETTGGAPAQGQASDQSNTLDAHGWAWDPEMHAATKSLTKEGLWRMKVGVSRPDPKPGFPKPAAPLDL